MAEWPVFQAVEKAVLKKIADGTQEFRAQLDAAVDVISLAYSDAGLADGSASCIRFSNAAFRWAYTYRYVTSHTHMVLKSLNRFWELNSDLHSWLDALTGRELTVCCVGGGPGSDMLGLSLFLQQHEAKVSCFCGDVLEEWLQWNETYVGLADQLDPERVMLPKYGQVLYWKFDFNQTYTWTQQLLCIQNADMVTMVKFVSAVSSNADTCQAHLTLLLHYMKDGAMLFVLDNATSPLLGIINRATSAAGLRKISQVHHNNKKGFQLPKGVKNAIDESSLRLAGLKPQKSSAVSAFLWQKGVSKGNKIKHAERSLQCTSTCLQQEPIDLKAMKKTSTSTAIPQNAESSAQVNDVVEGQILNSSCNPKKKRNGNSKSASTVNPPASNCNAPINVKPKCAAAIKQTKTPTKANSKPASTSVNPIQAVHPNVASSPKQTKAKTSSAQTTARSLEGNATAPTNSLPKNKQTTKSKTDSKASSITFKVNKPFAQVGEAVSQTTGPIPNSAKTITFPSAACPNLASPSIHKSKLVNASSQFSAINLQSDNSSSTNSVTLIDLSAPTSTSVYTQTEPRTRNASTMTPISFNSDLSSEQSIPFDLFLSNVRDLWSQTPDSTGVVVGTANKSSEPATTLTTQSITFESFLLHVRELWTQSQEESTNESEANMSLDPTSVKDWKKQNSATHPLLVETDLPKAMTSLESTKCATDLHYDQSYDRMNGTFWDNDSVSSYELAENASCSDLSSLEPVIKKRKRRRNRKKKVSFSSTLANLNEQEFFNTPRPTSVDETETLGFNNGLAKMDACPGVKEKSSHSLNNVNAQDQRLQLSSSTTHSECRQHITASRTSVQNAYGTYIPDVPLNVRTYQNNAAYYTPSRSNDIGLVNKCVILGAFLGLWLYCRRHYHPS